MKFFIYKKNINKNSLIILNKHIKFTTLLNLVKLHKKFIYSLFDFLYYNNKNNVRSQITNFIVSSKTISFFIKGGNSFTNSILLYNLFTQFYKIMYTNTSMVQLNNYKYYKEFFYNFSRYKNYKNLNYLLN